MQQNLSFCSCLPNIEISSPFSLLIFLLQRTEEWMHLAGWIRARSTFPNCGRCSSGISCWRNATRGRRLWYVL